MKKLYLILTFVTFTCLVKAQDERPSEKKQADIEALKVAFISKELDLTPEEAQKFWPVYNQYSKEIKATRIENPDVLERDEKVLALRKSYKEQFTKILGPQRVNNMYNAEGRFNQLLFKAIRRQNKMQNRPNKPLPRTN
jgi:hypothetical protein